MPWCQTAPHAAAAPNTYSDSRGPTHGGSGGWPRLITRAGPDALAFPLPRPFHAAGSPHEGVSRSGRLGGRGRRRDLVPGGRRWAGECVSVTGDRHSSLEWPASAVLTRGTGRKTASPLHLPRPPTPPGVHVRLSHRSSPPGVLCLLLSNGKDRRPIHATGCPRSCPRRTPRTESDTVVSLVVHRRPCVVVWARACGSRSAPARRSPRVLVPHEAVDVEDLPR